MRLQVIINFILLIRSVFLLQAKTFWSHWWKVSFTIFLIFLHKSLYLQSLHAEASSRSRGGGDGHIDNSVFLRFGFDGLKSWENFNRSQEQSNKELRWVCCIYTTLIMLVSLWCIRTIGITSIGDDIFVSAWSSELLVSTTMGNSQAPGPWSERWVGFTFFIYMTHVIFLL